MPVTKSATRSPFAARPSPSWNGGHPGDPKTDPEWTSYPVAQLRWNASAATWTLYWRDRNTRSHPYPHTPATTDVNGLLAEIEHNTTGAFWG